MRPIIGITCSFGVSVADGTYRVSERSEVGVAYIRSIEKAGGTPVVLPCVQEQECVNHYLRVIDGLLLTGGGDIDPILFGQEPHEKIGTVDRLRDDIELELTRGALAQDLPILGICRGIQVLAVAAGGTLYQDIPSEIEQAVCHRQKGAGWYASHTIDIQPGSLLHQIMGRTSMAVNSFHHQAVHEPGRGFIVNARTTDGVIEGIESPTHRFVLGLEFHPELMWEKYPEALNPFTAFVEACRENSGWK